MYCGALPAMIAARKKSGWQGEELELQHKMSNSTSNTAAAVDLSQFRNTEVGVGYQAKHVVRQRTGVEKVENDDVMQAIQDTNQRAATKSSQTTKQAATTSEMLGNKGLRDFRKEIESILNNP